jgi:IS5 family transposase
MPLGAFCLRHFLADFIICMCVFDFRQAQVCIPQRGGIKTPEREAYEKTREFKDGQRFRAGIEGRISVLFRGRGMKRCLAQGRERFELWVAAAVLANNLMKIAALLTDRSLYRRKAA